MPQDGRRNPWLDWLRLFGISAAVWLHIGGWGSRYTEFRMPLITLITAYVSTFSRDRVRTCGRLLISLAFWGSLQSLLWARYLTHNSPRFRWSELAARIYFEFFQGPLWYLSFAALVVLVAPSLRPLPGWATVLLSLLLLACSRWLIDHSAMPFRQWALVAPTVPLGWAAARRQFRYLACFLVGCLVLPNGIRCGPAVAIFSLALVAPSRYVPAAPERLGRLFYMGQVVGVWLLYYIVRRDGQLTPPMIFAFLIVWAAFLVLLDARRRALRKAGPSRRRRALGDPCRIGVANHGSLESI